MLQPWRAPVVEGAAHCSAGLHGEERPAVDVGSDRAFDRQRIEERRRQLRLLMEQSVLQLLSEQGIGHRHTKEDFIRLPLLHRNRRVVHVHLQWRCGRRLLARCLV